MNNYLDDEFDIEDKKPYSELSSNPIEDLTLEGRINSSQDLAREYSDSPANVDSIAAGPGLGGSANPQVKSFIKNRLSPQAPAPLAPPPVQSSQDYDYDSDPLMKRFDKESQDMADLRKSQLQANMVSGFGQALAPIIRGGGEPVSNDAFNKNLANQAEGILGSKEKEADRREKIMQAIESRLGRQAKVRADSDYRDKALGVKQQLAQSIHDFKGNAQDLATNRILGQVQNKIVNDPVLKPSQVNLASLGKASGMLNNPNVPVTPQILSDAEQDIASALSLRSQGATEGKIKRTEIEMIGRQLAIAKQKYLNKPDLDLRKEEPELVNMVNKMNSALMDDYKTTINKRTNEILDADSATFDHPKILQGIDRLRKHYNPVESRSDLGMKSQVSNSNYTPGTIIKGKKGSKFEGKTLRVQPDGSLEEVM